MEHVPSAEYVNKLVAQVTGGDPPTTIGVSVTGDQTQVQAKGLVVPVDDLLRRDKYDLGDFLEVNLRQHRWQGKQIGLPYGWTLIIWYYNADLFRTLGEKTPYEHWKAGTWTWDTYLDLTQRFKRVGEDTFGTASVGVPRTSLSFPLIWSNNGDVYDAQLTRSLLGEGPALETFEWMHKVHRSAPAGDIARTSTKELGKIAMWPDWEPWYLLNLQKMAFTYSIAPPPVAPKTKKTVFIGNAPGVGLVSGTKNPDEGWALLKHLVSPEQMRRYYLEANVSPLRKSQSAARDFWRSHPLLPDANLMYELAEARNKNSRIPPRTSNFNDLLTVLGEEFNAAWADRQSVRDAATKSAERATLLLKAAEVDR